MPGFEKGRRLSKIGLRAQDTTELSFNGVRAPVANLLGEEGAAFEYLSGNLPRERLAIAVGSVAQSRAALTATIEYVLHRDVFSRPLSSYQNTKFELASCATDLAAAESLLYNAIEAHIDEQLTQSDAAKVKLFCTEMQGRLIDRCLQLFGGYGYILDFPIARLYTDARVSRVYGGTSEIMKTIISKDLGL
jgi:acyl-CoA dehydrogenase